jgi:hypothetical protein
MPVRIIIVSSPFPWMHRVAASQPAQFFRACFLEHKIEIRVAANIRSNSG